MIARLTTPHGQTLRDAGRLLATATAIFSIAAGIIHVSAAADHTNLPVMMTGFLVVATLQVALGGLLLWRRPNRLLLLGAVAMMAGSIGLWLLSRTEGIPFLPGGHMEPIGFKDGITVIFELAAIPGLLLLTSRELTAVSLPSARLGSQTVSVLGTGAFLLMVPALMLGGGEHHSHDEMEAMAGHDHGTETARTHGHGGAGGGGGGHEHGSAGTASGSGAGHPHGSAKNGHGKSGHGTSGSGHAEVAGGHGATGHGATGHGTRGHGHRGRSGAGSEARGGSGSGGHDHGSGGSKGDTKRDTHGGHGGHSGDTAHADQGHSGEHGDDDDGPNGISIEPSSAGEGGKPGRGPAIVYRGDPSESEGPGHGHDTGGCRPTADQQTAADRLYRQTEAAMRRYDNAPWRALQEGFYYAFGPTDRIMHMVNPQRRSDPTILDAGQIESFLYAMTDSGWVAIGGMYIMPEHGMRGPEIGGCLTKWHYHGGFGGRLASAGTMEKTPEMLHVWTYPGLDPWGHYDGRELSQLWTPGKYAPSVCRKSGDSSDVCLP